MPLPIHIDGNGNARPLGNFPTPESTLKRMVFEVPPMVIAEADWVEFELSMEDLGLHIRDQDGIGACNGHAASVSLEMARAFKGDTFQSLSPWFIYANLCGGVDRGSNIGDALEFLQKTGTCLDSLVPQNDYHPNTLTAAAKADAANNKIVIGKPHQNFAEIMTAVQLRQPGNFSIRVGGNFNNLDSEGCPPVSPGFGNHAVAFGLGAKRMKNGKWAIKWPNSWTEQWGIKGCAWFHAGHTDHQGGFESYSVNVPSVNPNDPLKPPPVI